MDERKEWLDPPTSTKYMVFWLPLCTLVRFKEAGNPNETYVPRRPCNFETLRGSVPCFGFEKTQRNPPFVGSPSTHGLDPLVFETPRSFQTRKRPAASQAVSSALADTVGLSSNTKENSTANSTKDRSAEETNRTLLRFQWVKQIPFKTCPRWFWSKEGMNRTLLTHVNGFRTEPFQEMSNECWAFGVGSLKIRVVFSSFFFLQGNTASLLSSYPVLVALKKAPKGNRCNICGSPHVRFGGSAGVLEFVPLFFKMVQKRTTRETLKQIALWTHLNTGSIQVSTAGLGSQNYIGVSPKKALCTG